MTQLSNVAEKLIGRTVSVDIRGSRESYVGCLESIDVTPMERGVGPTVVMADDEGNVTVVFDVAAISTGDPELEDEESDEEEEDDEDDEEEDEDDEYED